MFIVNHMVESLPPQTSFISICFKIHPILVLPDWHLITSLLDSVFLKAVFGAALGLWPPAAPWRHPLWWQSRGGILAPLLIQQQHLSKADVSVDRVTLDICVFGINFSFWLNFTKWLIKEVKWNDFYTCPFSSICLLFYHVFFSMFVAEVLLVLILWEWYSPRLSQSRQKPIGKRGQSTVKCKGRKVQNGLVSQGQWA